MYRSYPLIMHMFPVIVLVALPLALADQMQLAHGNNKIPALNFIENEKLALGKFQEFIETYGEFLNKTNPAEIRKRYEIFKNNLDVIDRLNKEELGTAKYGITRFAHLTFEEFTRTFTGGKISPKEMRRHKLSMVNGPDEVIEFADDENDFEDDGDYLEESNEDIDENKAEDDSIETDGEEEDDDIKIVGNRVILPKRIDYRRKKAVTPVKDQGSCRILREKIPERLEHNPEHRTKNVNIRVLKLVLWMVHQERSEIPVQGAYQREISAFQSATESCMEEHCSRTCTGIPVNPTALAKKGTCGSCWAFSTISNIEGVYAKKKKKLMDLSEQELLDCDTKDGACNGGWMQTACKELVRLGGVALSKSYPYKGKKEQCKFNKDMAAVKITGTKSILADEKQIAKDLVKTGPISVAVAVSSNFQFYVKGVFDPSPSQCSTSENDVNHGVTLVGYGEAKIKGKKTLLWILKNSWGNSWGEKGYMRLVRDKKACAVHSYASTATL